MKSDLGSNNFSPDYTSPLHQLKSKSTSSSAPTFGIRRIFLLTHHKEICLVVDTAKLILAAFPISSRLVVAGMGPDVQESMREIIGALETDPTSCLILFPSGSEDNPPLTITELLELIQSKGKQSSSDTVMSFPENGFDLIVLDGTWEQAQGMYRRYILPMSKSNKSGCKPWHVQLSETTISELQRPREDQMDGKTSVDASGARQLRRHPVQWREISTLAALRFFFQEWEEALIPPTASDDTVSLDTSYSHPPFHAVLAKYQIVADAAARRQLGPQRSK